MRPDSWSTSYLLRSPFGISTSTSNSTDSTFPQTHAGHCTGSRRRFRRPPGLVSQHFRPTAHRRRPDATVREQRHWLATFPVRFLAEIVVVVLLATAVLTYRFDL